MDSMHPEPASAIISVEPIDIKSGEIETKCSKIGDYNDRLC